MRRGRLTRCSSPSSRLSFGSEEFSVSAPSILRTRRIISQWTKEEADALTEKVMALKTATEVKAMLQAAVK